jgi:hypothetical protein
MVTAVVFTFRLASRRPSEEQALPAVGRGQVGLGGYGSALDVNWMEAAAIRFHWFGAHRLVAAEGPTLCEMEARDKSPR